VAQIGAKWAPSGAGNDPTNLNSHWVNNVNGFLHQLGGSVTVPAGASHSPSPATGGANVGSSMGGSSDGLAQMVLQSNDAIAAGEKPSPLKTLDALVQGLAASGGSLGTPASTGGGGTAPNGISPPVAGHGITFNGQKLTHQTDGLAGYPAVDIFAKAGTPFLAPENGRVIRLSGRGGTSGNVFGYSVYFKGVSGKTYFITHLGPNRPRVGTRVRRGRPLGRVSPWQSGSSHAHVGIHG
jgi:murein DD-endopeptidase MepM/ murein hydrolase activator NlpD